MIENYDIKQQAILQVEIPLCGGGGQMPPAVAEIARKYRCVKKVCRKCYARLHPRATNCRKRKCGHTSSLRLKKMPKGK